MRFRSVILAVACASYAGVAACGGSTDTGIDGGPDGSGPLDSTTNDVVQQQNDAGNDVVTVNDTGTGNDASDGGTTIVDSGGIGSWQCGTAVVTDCSQCIGFTQPCVYCNVTDASDHIGTCVQTHTNCANGVTTQYQDCPCNAGDASACPESDQVCIQFTVNNGRCHTCSDQATNNGLTCENGGKCDYADGGCL
jgi:hypothetical protein